jgi:EAL domain-containing protein (putative c-di-GMP-specific phosphodiesterase class I)
MYYQRSMSEEAVNEQRIMSEAQAALDGGQFEVYLQPKYDLMRKCTYGAEALARWKHPARGLISPGQFIPVFEKNGFIAKLDFYIWEHTCLLLAQMDRRRAEAWTQYLEYLPRQYV